MDDDDCDPQFLEAIALETNDMRDWDAFELAKRIAERARLREILRLPLGRNEDDWYDDE